MNLVHFSFGNFGLLSNVIYVPRCILVRVAMFDDIEGDTRVTGMPHLRNGPNYNSATGQNV